MSCRHEVLNIVALCSSVAVREEALLLLHQPKFLSRCPTGKGHQGHTQIYKGFPTGSNRDVEGGKVRVLFSLCFLILACCSPSASG